MKNMSSPSLKIIAGSLLLLASTRVMAASCLDVFPTVLSSSASNGKVEFEREVNVNGTNGSLDIEIKKDETTDSNPSCITQKCTDSNNRSEAFSLPSFQTSSSSQDHTVGNGDSLNLPQGSYDKITVNFEATVRFTQNGDITFIKELNADNTDTTVIFEEGVYWIEKFKVGYRTKVIINGNDKVTLIIKNKKDDNAFDKTEVSFNVAGTPNQLVLIAYDDIKLGYNSDFKGFIYADKEVELKNENAFEGAINGDDIKLKYKAAISSVPDSSIESANFNGFCSVSNTPLTARINYRFDECTLNGEADDVIDQTGNYNGGSKGITPNNDSAIINKSLDLSTNNTSDWIDVPSSAVDGLDDFSVAVWFKTSVNKSQQEIFHALGNDSGDDELEIFLNNSHAVYIKVRDNSEVLTSNIELTDGNWHHLVLTRVDQDVCLFIDGTEQECDDGVNDGVLSVTNANAIVIGQEQDSFGGSFTTEQSFVGQLDEFKIFDVKLSDTEINNIYKNESDGNNFDGTPRDAMQCEYICGLIPGELNAVGIRIDSGGSDNQIDTISESINIHAAWLNAGSPTSGFIANSTYNVTESGASTVDRLDFGGDENAFAGTLPYPGIGTIGDESFSNFLVHTSGTLSLPAGDYTIYVESDDGFSFVMDTLDGDTVTFNKFGSSTAGMSNELRYENPTANTRTGGSFTLTQNSLFEITAIFFERTGSDFLEVSIANDLLDSTSTTDYEILREDALNNKVKFGQCAVTSQIDHYRIEHDSQGFTCEAEKVVVKACINNDENCGLYDQETTINLSPTGWVDGDKPPAFIGSNDFFLNHTVAETITLGISSASPSAPVKCFQAGVEASCDLTFSNDGFEIYGANFGDSLPDQLAASNFLNVNLRAVRSNDNVCEALLEGTQEISLSYDCTSPDKCLTPLNDITITNDLGENTGSINVEFNDQGVASLALLNYPDAGRLSLSVQAVVDGVTINNSDIETVDVYPSYLKLAVDQSELLYSSSGEQNNYIAGEPFTVSIGAYGVNNALLLNYQSENPQLQVTRIQPANTGSNGHFKYSDTATISAQLVAGFTSATGLSFSAGEHQYTTAYYDEVGRINVDVKDNSYLGNEILSNGSITLGDFYPAYFDVALSATPSLADTCGIFSYIGETITFATNPELTITAYNALNVITENYSDDYWNYLPNESTLEANLSFMDTSTYHLTGTASVIDLGDTPLITNNDNYNGSGKVTITNGRFRYNKVNPLDNSAFVAVSPFDAEISLAFSSDFFSSTFIDQNGNQDTICYQASYSDNTCLEWDIEEVTGTQMRYGRLTLESSYGPEAEPLNVPIKAEYFNNSQWLLNTDDSNCTSIALTETAGQIVLKAVDGYDLDLVGDVKSDGVLISGVPVGDQFQLKAPDPSQLGPGTQGQMELSLDPTAIGVEWPNHLNYDWNGDGIICNQAIDCPDDGNNTDDDDDPDMDFPESTITFGLFRGSDRIIQWREVSN
jgi:MSHA biogenesis protein MshQ